MSDLSSFMGEEEEVKRSPLDDYNPDRVEEEYYQKAVDNADTTPYSTYLIAAHNFFRNLVETGSKKKRHEDNVKILTEEMDKRDIKYYPYYDR